MGYIAFTIWVSQDYEGLGWIRSSDGKQRYQGTKNGLLLTPHFSQ